MTSLDIYHRLPGWARTLAASARGWELSRWRYGPDSERLVTEALERDRWPMARWEQWRQERLTAILRRAVNEVPYYKNLWEGRSGWEKLENWPILEKEPLRRDPRAFVARDRDIQRLFHDHTSGTSGTSLNIWLSRDTVRGWYALFEARCRRWYGVSRHDRWAMMGGQLVVPRAQRQPPFWVWNAGLNQLYMSSYHLSPDAIPHYLEALRRYRIRYLLGYTSSLYALAAAALERGLEVPRMKVAVANAEPVFDYQRRAIAKAFGCPVRETYGMAEIVTAASECDRGNLHLWPEAGITEVIGGELICTGLFNPDMPLIRYRVGDRGKLGAAGDCSCGRTLPVLLSLEGRTDDMLFTADGCRIGRLDPVFKEGLPIQEAQIIQEELDRVRVVYVPATGFDSRAERLIAERLRARMGPVRIDFEAVAAIPRGVNGKFRAVICNLPPEQRPASSLTVPDGAGKP